MNVNYSVFSMFMVHATWQQYLCWSSVDWLMWPHNNHSEHSNTYIFVFTFPFAIAFELPICYVFVEYSANRISFRLLCAHWEKGRKIFACVWAWVCVLYAYECVSSSLSFLYSPTLSHSLSQSLWRGLVRTQGKSLKPFIMSIMTDGLYMFTW